MIYRHTKEQVDEYYNSLGINQSGLKTLLNDGIEKFLSEKDTLQRQSDLYYEEKKHFIIGNGVDSKITHGEEVFKTLFYASQLKKKPGDKAMSVLQLAYAKAKSNFPLGPDIDFSLYKKEVYEACNEEAFYSREAKPTMEEDNRIGRLIKANAAGYWTDLILAEGKQLLSDDESYVINTIAHAMLNHKFTKHLFQDSPDIDIIYQLPMFWTYKDVLCKGLMDMLIINHKIKKIFPIDIKTIGDYITKFNIAVKRRRYDIQGSYYSFGINQNLSALSAIFQKDLSDYTIANFAFIADSTIKPGTPLVFPLSSELLEQGRYGDKTDSNNIIYGWEDAIEIYKGWEEIKFSLEKRVENNNGVIFIDKNYDYNIIL